MAGYDLIKTILQNPDNFSNAAGLERLDSLLNTDNFAAVKAEFESHFAFWNAIEPNLFNARRELLLVENEEEMGNCFKLASKCRFDLTVNDFKFWLTEQDKIGAYASREKLFESIAKLASNKLIEEEAVSKRNTELNRFTTKDSEELNKFKIYLRSEYIHYMIKTGKYTDDDLSDLALCDTKAAMQNFFSTEDRKFYLESIIVKEGEKELEILDEDTFSSLAETAAIRFLKNKITNCGDERALESFSTVKNLSQLKKIFNENPVLKLEGKELRVLNRLQESTIPELKALALINQKMLTATNAELSTVITNTNQADLVNQFKSSDSTNSDLDALEEYFGNNQNQVDVQNQAFRQLGKKLLKEMTNDEFAKLSHWLEDLKAKTHEKLDAGLMDEAAAFDEEKKAQFLKLLKQEPSLAGFDTSLIAIENHLQVEAFIRMGMDPVYQINNLPDVGYRAPNGLEALSTAEIHDIAFRLAERIIQETPANAASLVAADSLEKARNFFTNNLRITNLTWLSEKNFKTLRKTAYIAQIKEELVKLKPEEKDKHPALVRLLSQLSFNQLQQIQQKPTVYLPFLINTTDKARFKDILGPDNAGLALDEIIAENLSSQTLFKIENAALVKVISTIPGLVMTEEKLKEINDYLRDHNPHVAIPKNEIEALLKKAGAGYGFTLSDADLAAVQAQFTNNAVLYAYNGDPRTKPLFLQLENIYSFLLTYEKTAAITNQFINDFKRALSNTDSLAEFKGAFPMVPDAVKQSIFKNLTPALFQKLKEALFRFNLTDINQFDTTINNDRINFLKNLKERFDFLQEAEEKTEVWFGEQKTLHSELYKISKLDFISIQLTLANASEEDFTLYQNRLIQLEEACDAAIPELKDQLALLTARYESLIAAKVDRSKEDAKLDYMDELRQQIQVVRKELTFHTKAKLALRGDPSEPADSLKNKGAFQVLLETKTHQRILPEQIFKGYKIQYGEYKNADRDEVLKTTPAYKPVKASKARTDVGGIPDNKEETITTKKSKTGSSSVVRVTKTNASGADEDVAKFIEEPLTRGNKLTVAMFPSKTVGGAKGQKLNIDYIVASFTAAEAYLLKRKKQGIRAEVPIVINGETRDEIEGLYFALRTILKKYPQKGLTVDSVKLSEEALLCYDPRNIFGSYTDRDLTFEIENNENLVADIKNNPMVKRKIDEALEAWNPIAKHQEASKELIKTMDRNVHQDLKAGLTTMKQKAEEKPEEGLQKTPALKASDAEEEPKGSRPR